MVAKRIQEGLSATNDLTEVKRECHLGSEKMVAPFNIPPVSALDEYVRCRQMLGEVPLMAAVQEFLRRDLPPEIGTVIVREPGLRCWFGDVLFWGRVAQAATQRRA